MTALRVGSLCTGFGALDQAVGDVLGPTELVFVADPGSKIDDDRWDDGPVKLLAHRYPGVPNLGDITQFDWSTAPAVDVLAMGFPCTDVSVAGQMPGLMPGNRSGIWSSCAAAISVLRPSLVVIENVGGLLSARAHSNMEPCPWCVGDDPDRVVLRALGAVLGDLANLGFDAEWVSVNASDVGAPHRRKRVFIIAWPADAARPRLEVRRQGRPEGSTSTADGVDLLPTPDARLALRWGMPSAATSAARVSHPDRSVNLEDAIALLPTPTASEGTGAGHAAQGGRNLRTEVTLLPTSRATDGTHGGPNQRGSSGDLMLPSAVAQLLPTPTATPYGRQRSQSDGAAIRPSLGTLAAQLAPSTDRWGQYGAAIARWEGVTGRPAPEPTVPSRTGSPQLNPAFVEWLMGCDAGWVTAVPGLTRNQQLRLLGNGVVWQQGAYALRHLLAAAGFLDDSRSAA